MTVLAYLLGVLLLVVGLAASIALHEIGHLVPAKRFGVQVGQYMVGFGRTLWSRRVGETEYGIKAIPLGGYISMAGMYPPAPAQTGTAPVRSGLFATMIQDARAANAETLTDVEEARSFYRLPVWQRVIVMLGGPVMNLVLAILLFGLVATGIGIPTATTTVAAVSECVLPSGTDRTTCTDEDPASPAAAAGLLPGDVIVSLDGTAVSSFAETTAIIQASPERTLQVEVSRDGVLRSLQLTPMLAERQVVGADGQTSTAEVGFAGLTATTERVHQPLWAGPQAAFDQVGQVVGIIGKLPAMVYQTAVDTITGAERDPNGPLSVVGVGLLAGEVAAVDAPVIDRAATLLQLLAALNVALFVFNLIPLLPLDGGHVAIALWDGVRRFWAKLRGASAPAPTDATRLVPVTFVVVILLVAMTAVLILADLINPLTLAG